MKFLHDGNLFFFKKISFIFRERGREGEGGRETLMCGRNINWLPLAHTLTGDWACNPGMCPDQESNRWPFALQDDAPTNWVTPVRVALQNFKSTNGRMKGLSYTATRPLCTTHICKNTNTAALQWGVICRSLSFLQLPLSFASGFN